MSRGYDEHKYDEHTEMQMIRSMATIRVRLLKIENIASAVVTAFIIIKPECSYFYSWSLEAFTLY